MGLRLGEAVPDKPFSSQITLEVKHSGIEHTARIVRRKHVGGEGGGGRRNHIRTVFLDKEMLLMFA